MQVSVNFDGKNIFPIPFRLVFIDFCIEIAKGSAANAQMLEQFVFFYSLLKEPVSERFDDLGSDGVFFCTCGMNVCERLIKVDKQKFRFIIGTTCRYFEQATQNQVEQNVK